MRVERHQLIAWLDDAARVQRQRERRAGTWPPDSPSLQRIHQVRAMLVSNSPVYIIGKIPTVKEQK